MRYADRSDAELVELAQAGWSPAFAVLLHRHGPAVRSAVRSSPDPTAAVVDVFLRAMRQLPHRDPAAPVRPWLLELAGAEGIPDPVVPLGEEERDAVWAVLAAHWPDGRHSRHASGRVRRIALVAGLVGLSALVPTLVVLAGETVEGPTDELSAHPVEEETPQAEATEEVEPLPTFSFPSMPEDEIPPPPPETEEPEPDPEPTTPSPATPSPTPTPSPTEPSPAPEPTEPAEPTETTEPTDPEPPASPEPTNPEPEDEAAADDGVALRLLRPRS